jgi:hypothetical protein
MGYGLCSFVSQVLVPGMKKPPSRKVANSMETKTINFVRPTESAG